MEHILVYGKEHTFLDKSTGLLFRNSAFKQTAHLHTHTFYEIFIVSEGTALHMVNNTIQKLIKGDLIFIRPTDTHTYEFHCSEDFRIINIGFSKLIYQSIFSFLDKYEEFTNLTVSSLPPRINLTASDFDTVCQEFLQIGKHLNKDSAQFTAFYAKNCLSSIFVNYLFQYSSTPTKTTTVPEWFSHMLAEMQKIENLQFGFSRMVELSPCSKNHLCRLCKKFLAVTPTEYINEKRLEYSIYLLAQASDDIITISEKCGFNNLSHFYHLFKKAYHTSPLNFKKTSI